MRLFLVSLASIAVAAVLLVGAVYAVGGGTGIIDTTALPQGGELSATAGSDQIYANANCTSWLKVVILPHNTFEYEWLTVGTGGGPYYYYVQVYGVGILDVYFDSFVTISSISFTNTTGSAAWSILEGGVGTYYAVIYLNGTSAWTYNIVTNNIASNYWGSNTTVSMAVQEGQNFDSANCTLKI
jgi:hypothetical protein